MGKTRNSPVQTGAKRASFGGDGSSLEAGPPAGRPRVAVLPFTPSCSEKIEHLAFALAQEIAAALGRCCRFEVIAGIMPDSAAPSCVVREQQFRRLNLDYLVDLTLSQGAHGSEINARLLDLHGEARPIWSKRLGLANCDAGQIGELVATHIAGRIDPAIPQIEESLKTRNHYGATGFLRRAVPLMFSMEREKYQEAGQLIKSALEMEPDNAEIAAWAARWQQFNVTLGYTAHSQQEFAKVRDLALRSIKLNPENAEALGMYAHYCAFLESEFDTALHYFDRSLRLNSSDAFIWALSSATCCYIGEPKAALARLDHYRELAPFDPFVCCYELLYTIAYLFNQDYERAATVGRRAVAAIPRFVNAYKPLIAALGHLGRREEAKPYLDKLLTLEPGFTVERFGEVYPIKKAADRRRYVDGLRLAGVAAR